jgi:hypothetical protein
MFSGETYTNFATAGKLVKTGAGRACRLVVTAAVTGSVTLYDNTAGSGQAIWVSPANPAIGTSVQIDVPFRTGLYCTPGSAGAGIIVYS